jgi:hypothetical protein
MVRIVERRVVMTFGFGLGFIEAVAGQEKKGFAGILMREYTDVVNNEGRYNGSVVFTVWASLQITIFGSGSTLETMQSLAPKFQPAGLIPE